MTQLSTEKAVPGAGAVARPSLGHRILSHRWPIAAGILALAVLSLGAARLYVGPRVAVSKVVKGDLVRTVVASGHVETPFRVEIASQITAVVDNVLVEEGQFVHEGQPLVALATSELKAALVQTEAVSAQAEARLRQMRELTKPAADQSLKQAKATLANAEETFARAEGLAASGSGTRAVLETATRDLDVARTQVRTAELQVFTSTFGGSDYVMAETQLSQAQASLGEAKARLGYATIASPRDGILIGRTVERGTVVAPGKALLVLAPAGLVQLVLEIDEKNLGLLALGQTALASADAYPDKRFAAVLRYINPSVDISRASVEVKLTAADPPDYLRQDMTVSVDIEVAKRTNTLIVPARTLHDLQGAAPWVLVVKDGRTMRQPVRIGLRAGGLVEALEGLAAGDLLVPLSANASPGQRLRPVAP